MSCILRIKCEGDPAVLAETLRLRPDKIWRKGEPTRKGQMFEESGFSAIVSAAEVTDFDRQITDATGFLLHHCRVLHSAFKKCPWNEACLDFGLALPAHPAFWRGFPAQLVRLAAISHLGLELSFYAVDDSEESSTTEKLV